MGVVLVTLPLLGSRRKYTMSIAVRGSAFGIVRTSLPVAFDL
jgi:hypothetical protein